MGAASKMKYGLGYRTSTATVTAVLPAPEAGTPSHPRPTWGKLWKWFWRIPWIPMAYQCVKVRNEMSQGLRVALPNDSVILNSVVINLKTRYFNGGLLLNFWSVYLELGDGLWCIWWSIACDSPELHMCDVAHSAKIIFPVYFATVSQWLGCVVPYQGHISSQICSILTLSFHTCRPFQRNYR